MDLKKSIEEMDITEVQLDRITSQKDEYTKILKKAKWQGPFFYGGHEFDNYGYFSFATITEGGKFGGWWLVCWKNGTLRLTQNLKANQVGYGLTVDKIII